MFDTRAAVPIISSIFTEQHSLRTINRDIPLRINGADSCAMPGAREAFTHSLILKYKRHFTRETCDVMPLDGEIDIILPCWWMVKYQPSKFWGKLEEILLDSKFCTPYCTKAVAQEFSVSLDQQILYNYDATVIGYVATITKDTAEVDPATIIPEMF
jgi:hypothetical protein